ncbi:protein SPIRAL1-like 5 [Euphorbia lathyris]|uniref:protein SPIRAL1-like 5 n=1 Tax=Euphorbia lathyris TaxID=212925 RepID=UPI0033136C44
MSRGVSYGGGQSSLGYLFSSDEEPHTPQPSRATTTTTLAPYGVDFPPEKPGDPNSSEKQKVSSNYPRAQGQNSGNFITDRPSTKVKSVPGGDSSLGYLFGDK